MAKTEFIPDLLLAWGTYLQEAMITEIRHQQETVSKTLGENFKVGRENDDSISFWDSEAGITVLFAKTHMIISMQLPTESVEEKWTAFSEVIKKAFSVSSVPQDFSTVLCNARSYCSTSNDVDESYKHVESIMTHMSHGREMLDLLNAEVIDRQGVNEVQYRTVQNTQNQLYGLSLIYSRTSAADTRLSKDEALSFLAEENVPQQMLTEQKRLADIVENAIAPLQEIEKAT